MTSKDLGAYHCHICNKCSICIIAYFAYCAYIAYALHIVHVCCIECFFEHLQCNLVGVRLLSDSDDDPMDPTLNDDQAPGDWDALPVQLPLQAPPSQCRPSRHVQDNASPHMLHAAVSHCTVQKLMILLLTHHAKGYIAGKDASCQNL
jgi:hypothetical protein